MKNLFRRLISDPIDPELPLSLSDRFYILQEAKLDAALDRRIWMWTAMITIPFVAVFVVGITAVGAGRIVLGPALMAASLIMVVYAAIAISRRIYSPYTWRILRRKGHDVCLKCGYWLRSLGDGIKKCPECGAVRELLLKRGDA